MTDTDKLKKLNIQQENYAESFTQTGENNKIYHHSNVVHVDVQDGGALIRELNQQPWESARQELKRQALILEKFLSDAPRAEAPYTHESAIAWYRGSEEHTRPFAQALSAAIHRVPHHIVTDELKGFIEHIIGTRQIAVGYSIDYRLAITTYPLALIAYTVCLACVSSRQFNVLTSLIQPRIPYINTERGWLHVISYLNRLSKDLHFPTSRKNSLSDVVPESVHIESLLIGHQGWLENDISAFGHRRLFLVAEALLSFLCFLEHSQASGRFERFFLEGQYIWEGRFIREDTNSLFVTLRNRNYLSQIDALHLQEAFQRFNAMLASANSSWSQ